MHKGMKYGWQGSIKVVYYRVASKLLSMLFIEHKYIFFKLYWAYGLCLLLCILANVSGRRTSLCWFSSIAATLSKIASLSSWIVTLCHTRSFKNRHSKNIDRLHFRHRICLVITKNTGNAVTVHSNTSLPLL